MGVGVGLTGLAACSIPELIQDSRATIPPPPEHQEVIFWGDEQHPLDLAAEGFVAAYPTIEWHSPHPADRAQKLKAAFAADTGLPDLYWAEATEAQTWGCQGLLTDLTAQLKPEIAHYHPAKVAETFVARHAIHIGWPADLGVSGWYYRADQLTAMGWPEQTLAALTWADFGELAADLLKQGFYTYCFPAKGWSTLFFLILHQVGGTAVNQDGAKITINNEAGSHAMQLVKQLWEAGGGLAVSYGSAAYWAALKEGRLIGDFAPAWADRTWEANLHEADDTSAMAKWRVAPLPGGDGIVYRTGIWGGAQVVTPKAAANPEGARLFMHYALGSMEGVARYGVQGVIPAYRPYLQSAMCQAQRLSLFGDWPVCSFWATQEKELSPTYFRSAGWDAVNVAVQQEIMSIVQDTYAVKDGMSRIVERATPAFEQSKCE